jgi:hypothetical protein
MATDEKTEKPERQEKREQNSTDNVMEGKPI